MKIISFSLEESEIEIETEAGLTILNSDQRKEFENFLVRHDKLETVLEESETGHREPCRMSLEEYFESTGFGWIIEDLENFLFLQELRKEGDYERQTEKFLESIKHLINA